MKKVYDGPFTVTGRIPTQPALQNIPIRTSLGRKIREALMAHKADLSGSDWDVVRRAVIDDFTEFLDYFLDEPISSDGPDADDFNTAVSLYRAQGNIYKKGRPNATRSH